MEPGRRWEFFRPIVDEWNAKAAQSKRSKARLKFDEIAHQCHQFYAGSVGFMWDKQFANKYLGGAVPSKQFQITLNKCFEFVAVVGPSLYYQNPRRAVEEMRQFELRQEWLESGDPMMQAMFQMVGQQEMQRRQRHQIQSDLMRQYLNFTPDEQRGGGLRREAILAVTEAMITGRGVLWPESFKKPGSNRTLTGSFFDNQKNLLIDPDASRLEDAWWVMKEETKPYWVFEREFGLPRNYLRKYAHVESSGAASDRRIHGVLNVEGEMGLSNDLMTVRRVWSKMGIGGRLRGVDRLDLSKAFDDVVGDYAYLVVSDDVPWPLNAPRQIIEKETDDQIRQRFQWPDEHWRDGRWPFAEFRFYSDPSSLYPLPPLFAGLGELMYMNCFISQLAGKIAATSRTLIAVAQAAAKEVKDKVESAGFFEVFEIGEITDKIDNMIKVIEFNEVNSDAWRILDIMAESFEKATGLNEMAYGMPGKTQSRSATDSKLRSDATQVRPQFMRQQVFESLRMAADMEKAIACHKVKGADIVDVVGPMGALLWDQNISSLNPEQVSREVRMTVVPEDLQRPNKEQQQQAITGVISTLFPEFSKHADVTGDTNPANALTQRMLKSFEMEEGAEEMMMGPRQQQPPSEEEQQMQQQQMQLEMAKLQSEAESGQLDVQKGQVDVAKAQADLQKSQLEASRTEMDVNLEAQRSQMDMAKAQGELAIKQQELGIKSGELEIKAADQQQSAQQEQIKTAQMQLELQKVPLEIQKLRTEVQKSLAEVSKSLAEQQMNEEKHEQEIDLADQQMDLEEKKVEIQARQARQQAKAKPNDKT